MRYFGYTKKYEYVLFAISFILGHSCFLAGQEKTTPVAYDLKARIEPVSELIFVRAQVNFPLGAVKAHDFKFNLHETFQIKKLLVNGKAAQFTSAPNPSRVTPTAKAFTVTLPETTTGRQIQMEVDYEGKLKQLPEWGAPADGPYFLDDQVNSRMVELAGYSSWFPQFDFGGPVEAHLELSLPQGWLAICSGVKKEERVQNGRVITEWYTPKDLDVLIAASPNYKKLAAKQMNVSVEIYYTQMPQDFLTREINQIASAVRFYKEKLGDTTMPGGVVRQVYSPKRRGQGKAGIARPGLFLTSEGLTLESIASDPRFSLFQPIAHEIAHSWWNFGIGQGDWINESFAEYFSALAVRNASGEKEFQNIMSDYKKQVAELPSDATPLATVPFMNDNIGFVVRYYKGSVMLDNLREIMGDGCFFDASKAFFNTYAGKPTGTAEFRSFWKERLGDKKELIDLWLDSKGGVPNLPVKRTSKLL